MGGYSPTMGIIGTVLGLITALASAGGDPTTLISHIAAAFIANGDIRCGGCTNDQTTAMAQLGDFIPTIYDVISDARGVIESDL